MAMLPGMGERPVLVISNDDLNHNLAKVLVVPVIPNSAIYPTRVELRIGDNMGFAVLDEIRPLAANRILREGQLLSNKEIDTLKKALLDLF